MKRKKRRDAGRARGGPIVDAVLHHTLEALAEGGVEALSVEQVARRAQVNKTSVYRRWPTREALVAAALERVLVDVSAQVPDTGSLRGDLKGLLAPLVQLFSAPLGKAVLRASLTESSRETAAALAARQLEQTSVPMKAVIARAVARGEWRRGASGEQLVFMLVGALMHRALLEHLPLTPRWVSTLLDLALDGVRPRVATRASSSASSKR